LAFLSMPIGIGGAIGVALFQLAFFLSLLRA
jgi:hypothetical protein